MPPGVVTVTSTVPADCAGDVTVTLVPSLFTVVGVTDTEPNLTAVAPVSCEPVITTLVPPATEPCEGETPVTVGATKANWSAGWASVERRSGWRFACWTRGRYRPGISKSN